MKVFLLSLALLALGVFFLCFNIVFRNKPFPDGEISRNKEMRKRGIICANEEEIRLHGRRKKSASGKCDPAACSECVAGCSIREESLTNSKEEI